MTDHCPLTPFVRSSLHSALLSGVKIVVRFGFFGERYAEILLAGARLIIHFTNFIVYHVSVDLER